MNEEERIVHDLTRNVHLSQTTEWWDEEAVLTARVIPFMFLAVWRVDCGGLMWAVGAGEPIRVHGVGLLQQQRRQGTLQT